MTSLQLADLWYRASELPRSLQGCVAYMTIPHEEIDPNATPLTSSQSSLARSFASDHDESHWVRYFGKCSAFRKIGDESTEKLIMNDDIAPQ